MKLLVAHHGHTPAADFSPLAFAAVHHAMIERGWGRRSINKHAARVRAAFKWGVERELVPAAGHHGLQAVAGLKAGRSAARETDPVRPVPVATVEQTLPALPPTVADRVRLQLLTGARPGEIVGLTTAEVDRTDPDVWAVRPRLHKNAYRGHGRTIMVGPQARAVLAPHLNPADPTAAVFSPAGSKADRRAKQTAARVTPAGHGNLPGTNRLVDCPVPIGDRYTVTSYRPAVARACDAAYPPPAALARRRWEPSRHGGPNANFC